MYITVIYYQVRGIKQNIGHHIST